MNYKEYEKECEIIRAENADLIQIFKSELEKKGLSPKTIKAHVDNVDLYMIYPSKVVLMP